MRRDYGDFKAAIDALIVRIEAGHWRHGLKTKDAVAQVHPAAAVFPMLSDDELDELAADIKANGLRYPIVLDAEGRIVDGINRHAACLRAGVEPTFITLADDVDVGTFVLSQNIHRRHLSAGQRAMAVAILADLSQITTRTLATETSVSQSRVVYANVVRRRHLTEGQVAVATVRAITSCKLHESRGVKAQVVAHSGVEQARLSQALVIVDHAAEGRRDGQAARLSVESTLSESYVNHAVAVRRYAPDLAPGVLANTEPFDRAYTVALARKREQEDERERTGQHGAAP